MHIVILGYIQKCILVAYLWDSIDRLVLLQPPPNIDTISELFAKTLAKASVKKAAASASVFSQPSASSTPTPPVEEWPSEMLKPENKSKWMVLR